jgi:hypothetical protein
MSGRSGWGWGLVALALTASLGACALPVDYTGAFCSAVTLCPDGYVCDVDRGVCAVPAHLCVAGGGSCGAHATLTKQLAGYGCACDDGYVGDGLTCAQDLTRLTSLTVDLGGAPLALGFQPGVLWYPVAAPPDATAVTVRALPIAPDRVSLTIAGRAVASGEAASVPLVHLQATVAVTVTDAAGGNATTYTVVVTPQP